MLKDNQIAVNCLNSIVNDVAGQGRFHGAGEPKKGFLYGLELELEGHNVGMEGQPSKNWRRVEDGSLRGESIEYIFANPCEYEEATKRVDALFKALKKNNVKLKNSYRTSTHVHLNFSDKVGKQVVNFFILYTICEEILEYYCGNLRKGNLFCLSARDTEHLVDMLEESIFIHGCYNPFNNDVRYNAANLAALNKFGTIELRAMRGADSADQVNEWLEILKHLYEFSCSEKCPPPYKLAESLSHLGPDGFLRQVFPQKIIDKLMRTFPPVRDVRQSLLDGVRLVQMLAYKLEEPWNEEHKKPSKKEPKGLKLNLNVGVFNPDDPLNNAQNNQILKPDGSRWWVRLGYGHGQQLADDPDIMWDAINHVFIHVPTGHKCRWVYYRGINTLDDLDLDREVNYWLHEDDEENDPDEDWRDDDDD